MVQVVLSEYDRKQVIAQYAHKSVSSLKGSRIKHIKHQKRELQKNGHNLITCVRIVLLGIIIFALNKNVILYIYSLCTQEVKSWTHVRRIASNLQINMIEVARVVIKCVRCAVYGLQFILSVIVLCFWTIPRHVAQYSLSVSECERHSA